MKGKIWDGGVDHRVRREGMTYVKKDKRLGPVDRIPLEVLCSSLQYLLIDTSHHLSHTTHQRDRGDVLMKLTVTQR